MAESCNRAKALSLIYRAVESRPENRPFIIAIDGRTASGKTTFAERLSASLGAAVVHTDDFYRPRNSLGELAISEFEGNFDIKRFKREIIDRLDSETAFSYGVFDCKKGKITRTVTLPPRSIYIVEGAYSLCSALGDYASIKLFFDVSPEKQTERILSRNGAKALEAFQKLWIPAEERYISHYNVQSICDFIISEEI